MSLLEVDRVSKRFGSRTALEEVSFVIEEGELVAVWGERRSGRSTLIRACAGVEQPDAGEVRFAGKPMSRRHGTVLGRRLGFVRRTFAPSSGATVLEQLLTAQLARRVPRTEALSVAWRKLDLAGVERCARERPDDLTAAETIRVALARVLTAEPQLIVVDEPTIGVELLERDPILELLSSLTRCGTAVLMTAAQGTGLLGADRVLAVAKGRVQGQLFPETASVTPLLIAGRKAS